MFTDPLLGTYLLWGIVFAATFYLLRQSIDRDKGALWEVGSVTFPIVVAAVLIALSESQLSRTRFGLLLGTFIQIEFVGLQFVVMFRLIERQRRRSAIQLADMFRITATVSLLIFVFSFLAISESSIGGATAALTLLMADKSRGSQHESRMLGLIFATSFVCLLVLKGGLGSGTLIEDGPRGLATLLPQIAAPRTVDWFMRHSRLFQSIAVRVVAWRQCRVPSGQPLSTKMPIDLWLLRHGVTYLNHGSFGATPIMVQQRQSAIARQCQHEPMDWLVRNFEKQWLDARLRLSAWIGAPIQSVAFCENATVGMNTVADGFPLAPDDEVVLTNHEYGAVKRIWASKCQKSHARLTEVPLDIPIASQQSIIDTILNACTDRTRLVVISHITSPTAIRMPVERICELLRERNIASCIDGPHALMQESFRIYSLRCDFYTASCHKWLCGPLGSGFLYVAPEWSEQFRPGHLSWGRLPPASPNSWSEEMIWTGTRDYSAYLAVPSAIAFFNGFDWPSLDERNHGLACYARQRLIDFGCHPISPEGREWFGWMVSVALPVATQNPDTLQQRLWEKYHIEVPVYPFAGKYLIRVSCHLYNTSQDIDYLVTALRTECE